MLIARAPLRISLAGGGTDLPAYFERFGGLVVSATIDKFVYAQVAPNGATSTQITSADYRTFYRHPADRPLTWEGELALPKAVLHELGVTRGLAVFLASEVPPGTGLGSSSALAVALLQATAAFLGRPLPRQRLAELACKVELHKLGAPIGKQDQFAAAFGGLNRIAFAPERVEVTPLHVLPSTLAALERRLLLFFTGTAHDSAQILREQTRATRQADHATVERLHRIKDAAERCVRCLEEGDLDGIGALLDEGWQIKRQLTAGISTGRIDRCYALARACGAAGGKITGAGGGGFLLVYCEEAKQEAVSVALEAEGLKRMDFHFERQGVSVGAIEWLPSPSPARDPRLLAV